MKIVFTDAKDEKKVEFTFDPSTIDYAAPIIFFTAAEEGLPHTRKDFTDNLEAKSYLEKNLSNIKNAIKNEKHPALKVTDADEETKANPLLIFQSRAMMLRVSEETSAAKLEAIKKLKGILEALEPIQLFVSELNQLQTHLGEALPQSTDQKLEKIKVSLPKGNGIYKRICRFRDA